MALSIVGGLSLTSLLNLSTAGNAVVVPLANTRRLALSVNNLTGSGAMLAIDGSKDGGASWATTGMSAVDYDLGTAFTALPDDADYRVITRGYTHLQVRVATAGTGSASVILVSQARAADAFAVNAAAGTPGMPSTVSDPALEAAVGAPTDPPWSTGAGTLVALGKAIVGKLSTKLTVTVTDMLPAGTNFLGSVTDPQNASYSTWPVITAASGTYTPPAGMRTLSANVTTAGNITLTDAAGNAKTFPLVVGYQTIPYLPTTFTTTATATFWADK